MPNVEADTTVTDHRRELSSRRTFFYKFIVPLMWILAYFGTAAPILSRTASGATEGDPALLILGAIISIAVIVGYGRLKRVWLTDTGFIVSNYRETIEVKLRDVQEVSGSRFISPATVSISLRTVTPFGPTIVFVPEQRWFRLGFKPHPLVNELRERISQPRLYG